MKEMDLRVVKTKIALQEALMFLLKEKTLPSISITELCRIAQVNRGTFYYHYGQVEQLFEAYFNDIMKDLTDSYLEPYKHVRVLQTEELNPSTIRIFHHIKKYETFYCIVFSPSAPVTYYYLLFDHIQSLIKKDLARYGNNGIDITMQSAYQSNAILGLVMEWYRQGFRQNAAELNQQLVRILNV